MSRFTRRVPALQDLFPSSDRSIASPTDFGEVVQPTHEFPGPAFRLEQTTRQTFTTASAVAPFGNIPVTPPSLYDEIFAAHVAHNSATARIIQLFLVDPAGNAIIVVRIENLVIGAIWSIFGEGTAGGFRVPRPLVVGPGWTIQVQGDTAGAAYDITFSWAAMRKTIAEKLLF